MRLGSSLTLITLGAILIFAVRAEPRILDLDAVGLILIIVGGAGIAINHAVWERRKEAAQLPFQMDDSFDSNEYPVRPTGRDL